MQDDELCQCSQAQAEREEGPANKKRDASNQTDTKQETVNSKRSKYKKSDNGDQVAVNIDIDQIKNNLSSGINNGINSFLNPATKGGAYFKSLNYKKSVTAIIISGIVSAIFAFIIGNKANNGALSLINRIIGSPYNGAAYSVEIFPLAQMFILVFIYSVIISVALAVICYLSSFLFGIKANLERNMAIAALRSAYTVPIKLLAIIISIFSPEFGVLVFFLASSLISTSIVVSVSSDPSIPQNRMARASVLIKLVFIIVFIVFGMMALKTFVNPYFRDALNYLY